MARIYGGSEFNRNGYRFNYCWHSGTAVWEEESTDGHRDFVFDFGNGVRIIFRLDSVCDISFSWRNSSGCIFGCWAHVYFRNFTGSSARATGGFFSIEYRCGNFYSVSPEFFIYRYWGRLMEMDAGRNGYT